MGTNEINKKENKTIKFIVISILIIAVISLIGFAYARYVTSLNGGTQAPIARWNFNVTAGSSQSLNIDLAQTRYTNDTTEVDRTKVAPGTAGAIQLNVDASGSQVSLEYDIDLSLTQIPENLIFYSDAEMTKALYKENGVIHLDGYFGANDNNKTATQNLYWQWKLETGTTQAEIDANDLLDSEWMGDRIVLGVQATGRQVMDNPTTQYAVTFDLNGGTLANHGDSAQVTKQVTYGDTYGTLPTPTREGYTFIGWNGKNLLDLSNRTVKDPGGNWYNTSKRNNLNGKGIYKGFAWNNYYLSTNISDLHIDSENNNVTLKSLNDGYGVGFDIRVLRNTQYTLSSYENTSQCRGALYQEDGTFIKSIAGTFTTTADSYWLVVVITSNRGVVETQHNIQLEIGTTATTYEPYYITSSTEVVQNKNHTLTAIWEPVSNP